MTFPFTIKNHKIVFKNGGQAPALASDIMLYDIAKTLQELKNEIRELKRSQNQQKSAAASSRKQSAKSSTEK